MNLTLRVATDGDSEFVYETKKAAFRGYVEQVWGWNEEEQRLLHYRRFSSQEVQIIQFSGKDVGFLSVVRSSDCFKINQMYILPEHQNKGIGRACAAEIIEHAALAKVPVRLQVLKVNPRARVFWASLGFAINGESETHFLMELALRE